MAPIIRIENLRKVYRIGNEKVVALNNINLDIEKGEICCIIGSSGSGKSTLLNQLAGLEKPTKGSVIIGGHNISQMSEKDLAIFRQKNLGFIFQSYNLLPTMTAIENVALPLMFKGVPRKVREKEAMEQLKKMGLKNRAKHKPTEMSGGQQQRVGIARAFVSKPKIIFADEPTGNLDSATTKQVLAGMISLAKENNITFIMVTHERELAGCADRIITLKDGCVINDEKTDGTWLTDLVDANADIPEAEAGESPPQNASQKNLQSEAQPQAENVKDIPPQNNTETFGEYPPQTIPPTAAGLKTEEEKDITAQSIAKMLNSEP